VSAGLGTPNTPSEIPNPENVTKKLIEQQSNISRHRQAIEES
jgi:hypothetical protein